jgi:hypothetical protein
VVPNHCKPSFLFLKTLTFSQCYKNVRNSLSM